MDGASRDLLTALLDRSRAEIVDRGTDWVRAEAIDLGTQRPRDETRALVERVVSSQSAALLDGDERPLNDFLEIVTLMRAASEFHVSTILRGQLSFRRGLGDVLREMAVDRGAAALLLDAVDTIAQLAVFRAADLYNETLNGTILRRRVELEQELARLTAAKEKELDEKARTIDAQREELNAHASPVIRVWEGILVAPLIGEIDPARAAAVRERVLLAVMAARARSVLVDITGLTVIDESLASELLHLVHAVRLIGAETLIVGISPEGARAFAAMRVRLGAIRSFATLHDGLHAAFEGAGLRVVRA